MNRALPEMPTCTRLCCLVFLLVLWGVFLFPCTGIAETYGTKDAQGNFVPKITVDIGSKEIVIKKTDPRDKFRSLTLALNLKNAALLRNVDLLKLEWIDAENRASKPIPFAGPRYDPNSRKFKDTMIRSIGLKIINTSRSSLFAGKRLSDLFRIEVDDEPLVTAESVAEGGQTVQLGTGRDLSINLDRTSIVFNENNYKTGEFLNIDNRSGMDQVLGVEIPSTGMLISKIVRKPQPKTIQKENWDRFTLPADSGIFILMIPEPDPAQMAPLDGKDVIVKVFDGNRVRETRKIPIKIASDLRSGAQEQGAENEDLLNKEGRQPPRSEALGSERSEATPGRSPAKVPGAGTAARPASFAGTWSGTWIWILQAANLVLVLALGVYSIFFILPKMQVLEDRLAKNEIFIHGSREAIREELDQIKQEILKQCQVESAKEDE